jgi:hypothetical protein
MSDVVRALLDRPRRTQFMPPEHLRVWQHQLLEPPVRHARAHVPFDREGGRLTRLFRADDTVD